MAAAKSPENPPIRLHIPEGSNFNAMISINPILTC
jgi:hypothetical protein